jgi:signal transduction histidine kinase
VEFRPRRLATISLRDHLPRRTVRLRLTALYGGLFLASGAILLAVTYLLVRHNTSTMGAYTIRSKNGVIDGIAFAFGNSSHQGAQIGGKVVGPPQVLPGIGGAHVASGSGSAQVTVPSGLSTRQITTEIHQLQALALTTHAHELHALLMYSGLALGIMALLSIVLGWFVAGRVLRPLRTITTAARDISATNLHERLDLDGPDDELKELGDTFDGLLGRLDAAFVSQRQFVANASHELRTPLARQRTLAQVALADPNPTIESLRAAHERVLVSGEQQEQLIEALLTLSRVQAGTERRESFDLAGVTRDVVDSRMAEAELRGLSIDAVLDVAMVKGDPRLVERLVVNLVENALRHNVLHGHIDVATGVRNGHAILAVTNDGPIVPTGEVDRLFEPFQRLGTERTGSGEGAGLGLCIVLAVALAHEAQLTTRARPQGGLSIEVSFAAADVVSEPSVPVFLGSSDGKHPKPPSATSLRPLAPRGPV